MTNASQISKADVLAAAGVRAAEIDQQVNTLNNDLGDGPRGELLTDRKPKVETEVELTFDEKVQKLFEFIDGAALHRELFYKILKFCLEQQPERVVEEHIATYAEFKQATKPQYFLMRSLVREGGLDKIELDHQGNLVTAEQKEGLDEDGIDDLVATYAYITTGVGCEVIKLLDPKQRLLDLLEILPERYDTYIEILEFLTEKKDFGAVDTLLRGRPILETGHNADDRPIQPSVFVDKLERAGGIAWDDGWFLTDEGKELLATIKKRTEK